MSLALYYVLAYLAVAFVVAVGWRRWFRPESDLLLRGLFALGRAVDWCARHLPPQHQGEQHATEVL